MPALSPGVRPAQGMAGFEAQSRFRELLGDLRPVRDSRQLFVLAGG